MQQCTLTYIPTRLHQDDKPIINYFVVGELLYRRCKPEELDNPFKNISITELSHNRSGMEENVLCNAADVLYNINPDELFEKHETKVVCVLVIKDLSETNGYKKNYTEEKQNETYNCVIELFHEPEPCMYPHCVLRVWVNNEVITFKNYDKTIKKLHQIRTQLKEELAAMILKKQVSQNDTPSEE